MTSELQAGTREEGVVKRPASASGERESDKESCEEERGEQDKSDEEFGEWFLPSRGEEDEEVADRVRLNWRLKDETIRVGVLPHLGEDIILRTDYVDFPSLLTKEGQEHILKTWWEEVPLGVGEDESRRPRIKLSRKQKREQLQKIYTAAESPENRHPRGRQHRLYNYGRFPSDSTR
ncbi:hypothetical protein NDU88_005803 [Pleurodeles waltl]|uniref:Uncharacterized protein n=1 Tax=Pleurodeles waltl TaxID=8319 RepID=A0AAV7SMX1_PLEWA|nr:hypothetical protein NDU88_005803 [Pleurodeles waltl]